MRSALRDLRAHAIARSLRPAASLADAVAACASCSSIAIRAPARAPNGPAPARRRVSRGRPRPRLRSAGIGRGLPARLRGDDARGACAVAPRSSALRFRVEREHPRSAARVLAHVERHGETHLATSRCSDGIARSTDGAATRPPPRACSRRCISAAGCTSPRGPTASRCTQSLAGRSRTVACATRPGDPAPAARPLHPSGAELPRDGAHGDGSFAVAGDAGARARRIRVDPGVARLDVDGIAWRTCRRARRCSAARTIAMAPRSVRSGGMGSPTLRGLLGMGSTASGAYPPPAKAEFGYYALPMLWRDDVVGWVNARRCAGRPARHRAGIRARRSARGRIPPGARSQADRLRGAWAPRASRFADARPHPRALRDPHGDLGLGRGSRLRSSSAPSRRVVGGLPLRARRRDCRHLVPLTEQPMKSLAAQAHVSSCSA